MKERLIAGIIVIFCLAAVVALLANVKHAGADNHIEFTKTTDGN